MDERPWALEESALLAVESWLSAPLPDSDEALRSALDLLEKPLINQQLEDPIRQLSYSPTGQWLVTATEGHRLTLRNPNDGKEIHSWKLDAKILSFDLSIDDRYLVVRTSGRLWIFNTTSYDDVTPESLRSASKAVAFAPRGHRAAIASDARSAQIVDLDNPRGRPVQLQTTSPVLAVAFSTSGNYVAAGGADGICGVFNASTGRRVDTVTYGRSVALLRFTTDGKFLAVAGNSVSVAVFDLIHHTRVNLASGAVIKAMAVHPMGPWVAIGGVDPKAQVFDGIKATLISHTTHQSTITALSFSANGRWLGSGSSDRTIHILDWNIDKEIQRFAFNDEVTTFSFSPDNRFLAGASSDGQLQIFKITDHSEILHLPLQVRVTALDLSPDLNLVAVGGDDGTPRVFNIQGKFLWQWAEKRQGEIVILAFSPDNRLLATGETYSVRVFNVAAASAVNKPVNEISHSQVSALAFSPDSQSIITGTDGPGSLSARVFSALFGGRDLIPPLEHEQAVGGVVYSQDGRWLATGSNDKFVRLYEAKDGVEKRISPMRLEGSVTALILSPKSQFLVAGSDHKTAAIFALDTQKKLVEIPHSATVVALAMTADEKLLISGSRNGLVQLSEVPTGRPMGRIDNKDHDIRRIRISPDGRELWTAAVGPTFISIRRFFLHGDDLVHEVCSRISRNFTSEEWTRYFPNESYRKTCQLDDGSASVESYFHDAAR